MPRRNHRRSDRKQAESTQRAREKRLRQLGAELRAEWRAGRTPPTDTVSVIRAAEQWQIKLKQRRERRREEAQRERQRRQQAA
jgi:hypothetical protein